MLSRLNIRQKIGVLLAIPLTAVALLMAFVTVGRVSDANVHGVTADTALAAREVGNLIQSLQQERLVALGYLASPNLERSAVVLQSQAAADETARLAAEQRTAPVIAKARTALDALVYIRRAVLDRTIDAKRTYNSYRNADLALIDGLNLSRPAVIDAAAYQQLLGLDALMRSNEEATSAGALIIGESIDPSLTPLMVAQASAADAESLLRFHQFVGADEATLMDNIQGGEAGLRVSLLVAAINDGHRPTPDDVSRTLTATLTYTGLRRLAQDRVARDVATRAQADASAARTTAVSVAAGATLLFLAVLFLAVTIGRSISTPLRRLTRAVGVVAEVSRSELVRVADADIASDTPAAELVSVDVEGDDEISELAAAVNGVQATAVMLLERQATARANVATMFANVSRRTQNLVGRQMQLIGELEHVDVDAATRERLGRLDHLTARLRRSADSLLVLSGTVDQQLSTTPLKVSDIVASVLSDIEGHRAVDLLGDLPDVLVSAELAGDLRLLLAELIENATNFSPPGATVQVGALSEGVDHAWGCTIAVIDHGVGMSPARIDEENRRLVERERLDVTPTRVLGLFVVGRLARRHGMVVRLELTPGGGISAVVRVPSKFIAPILAPHLRASAAVLPAPIAAAPRAALPGMAAPAALASAATLPGLPTRRPPSGIVPPLAIAAIEDATRSGPFAWLGPRREPSTRGDMHRVRNPEAERDAVNDYVSGLERAARESDGFGSSPDQSSYGPSDDARPAHAYGPPDEARPAHAYGPPDDGRPAHAYRQPDQAGVASPEPVPHQTLAERNS